MCGYRLFIANTMSPEQEMHQVKDRIAQVYARREALKKNLEAGAVPARAGLAQLGKIDVELSGLDSRFKQLWDARQVSSPAVHPAAAWAGSATLEPVHLDCVTAIMLKILDAKCKMGEAEKNALTAAYDVLKDRPGQGLDASVHDLIARARQGKNAEVAAAIHDWRVRAEAYIPKPVMKGFKQMLRAHMPMH